MKCVEIVKNETFVVHCFLSNSNIYHVHFELIVVTCVSNLLSQLLLLLFCYVLVEFRLNFNLTFECELDKQTVVCEKNIEQVKFKNWLQG